MSPKPQDAPWSDADDLNVCLMHAVVGIRWHLLEHLALGRTSKQMAERWHAVVYGGGELGSPIIADYARGVRGGQDFKAAFLAVKRRHPAAATALYLAHGTPEENQAKAQAAAENDKLLNA